MDKEALELDLARRLVAHLDAGTTDLAPDLLELSTDLYRGAHHEREVTVLFHDRPLVFCLSGALPGPDTFQTVDLCGTPILVTRDRHGKVRAFANVCRHRGVRVVDGSGRQGAFACPFHAWVYDNEGALIRVPSQECFGDLDRARHGLTELPVAEGYGVIVGRLRPGPAVDIDEYLGPELAEEFGLLDFGTWVPTGDPHVHRVSANWKVTLDTFREN